MMKNLLLSSLAFAGLVLATPGTTYAHGGQYRGPGDVVPPDTGGGGRSPGPSGPSTPGPGGPSTPGPGGPSTPGPSGPVTAGPSAPAGGAGPTTGPRGAQVGPDLSKWQFWWEFNKDPFINLRAAIHTGNVATGGDEFFLGGSRRGEAKDTMKPSDNEILNRILPDLKRALDSTDNRDITSSVLVAMGKIGKDTDSIKILSLMKARLKASDQEVRETAAVAMGISAMPAAVDDLAHLVKDAPEGRAMLDRSQVDDRTRAFAGYGLGLIAYATNNVDVKRRVFETLKEVLADKSIVNRNVLVAAINGVRLVRPNADGDEKDKKLLADCVDMLWDYYGQQLGQGRQQVQAHVPPAIAQLLGRGSKNTEKYKDEFMKELTAKRQENIYQSAALALGLMAESQEVNKNDKKYSDALLDYYKDGKDEQARYFSLMALAKIGGNSNRQDLLKIFAKGNKATVKPWAAVSLGVLAHNAYAAAGDSATIDTEIGRTLQAGLKDVKNDEALSAIAIGLGLTKYTEAADDLQDMLVRNKQRDEFAGYLCVGLALMNAQSATEDIKEIVTSSVRRPDLLKQAAIALGKLGDKTAADLLQTILLDTSTQTVAKLSAVASALGFIGDRRSIDPLIKTLFDESLTELSRAFAAVALGGVADKEQLPWNSKIAVDMNYRAAVETLTNGVSGVLDIL